MKVSIIGSGYVGLVTGACLAAVGNEVVCVDLDSERVAQINGGRAPFFEPGLDGLLEAHAGNQLRATTDLEQAVLDSELTLIAVGTPFDGATIDLGAIRKCTMQIGDALARKDAYHVVVVKSTVVPGTTREVVLPLLEEASGKRAGDDFGVGMNPEFLTEGEAVGDFMDPDRIVIGGIDDRSTAAQAELYSSFDAPVITTNLATAELIKYTSNALLATLISFSNEIADVGAAVGDIDVVDVMRGLHSSRYFGSGEPPPITSFLMAGCGFGGSCLPKDVSALVAHGRSFGVPMEVLDGVLSVNARRTEEVFRLLYKHVPELDGVTVAVLGLAFRPDTSDMRESPAIPIIERLLAEGAAVRAYDPAANDEARTIFGERITLCANAAECIDGADAVILVTRWSEFESLPDLLGGLDEQPVLIDGRRMLDKSRYERYEGIGL